MTIPPTIRSVQPLLSCLVACLALAACSQGGSGGAPPPDTVRFDLTADPTNLNPLFYHPDAATGELQLARLAFEPFIDLDATGKPMPALLATIPTAANGGISADGRTLTYHLRPGVKWSDGEPVRSDDVLYTLHAILDPKNSVRSHEGYDLIDSATAPNASTVVFHLKHAWAPAVMSYFSYGTTPQFVLPAHVLRKQEPLDRAAFNAAPSVGDGPYTFVSWQHGDRLRYAANPLYWRGKAKVATLDVRIAPDPSTNLVMLQSGSLDWNLIAPVQYQLLAGKPGLQFATTPTAVVAGLVFNTQHPHLNDVRVRRAIAMAIDRDSISKKITLGKYPVTNMMQPQFSWAYDASIRQPRFNAKAAEAVLRPLHLHLTYVQFPESITGTRVATTVQAELKDVGVDVTIKSVSNQQLFLPKTGQLAAGAFDMAYVPFTLGGDPDDSFVLGCQGAQNYMRWCNADVDAAEAQALSATSQTERKMLYGKIARIVADQVPLLYLFNADYIYAYRSRLHGFAPNAFLPSWNAGMWSL